MFGFMLFLHLAGLFIWLGALFAIVVMLLVLSKQLGSAESNSLAKKIIQVFSRFTYPAAVIVLISGVYMILQLDLGSDKPLWLNVMEKGGGTLILLALVLTGITNRGVKKRLSGEPIQRVKLSGYVTTMSVFMVLILSLVLIVSMKI